MLRLYARLRDTAALGETMAHWDLWVDVMKHSQAASEWIKRAVALDVQRPSAFCDASDTPALPCCFLPRASSCCKCRVAPLSEGLLTLSQKLCRPRLLGMSCQQAAQLSH